MFLTPVLHLTLCPTQCEVPPLASGEPSEGQPQPDWLEQKKVVDCVTDMCRERSVAPGVAGPRPPSYLGVYLCPFVMASLSGRLSPSDCRLTPTAPCLHPTNSTFPNRKKPLFQVSPGDILGRAASAMCPSLNHLWLEIGKVPSCQSWSHTGPWRGCWGLSVQAKHMEERGRLLGEGSWLPIKNLLKAVGCVSQRNRGVQNPDLDGEWQHLPQTWMGVPCPRANTQAPGILSIPL